MNKIYYWADLHIGHSKAYTFDSKDGDRKMRPFKDMYEGEKIMVDNYNSIVKDNDIVYFLGDVLLDKSRLNVLSFMKKGAKHLVLGNHDNKGDVAFYRQFFDKVYGVLYRPKIKSILSHIPVHPYFLGPQDYLNGDTRFNYNIHGHCVSKDTEILTLRGWKNYKNLIIGEQVYSLNNNLELEIDYVENKIIKYSDSNFSLNSKGLNMSITDDHNIALLNCRKNNIVFKTPKEALKNKALHFPRSGVYKNKGLDLSDDLIRLYIYLAADGNIKEETKLCRLVVKKQRKIDAFKKCLQNLKIDYKQYPQKDGSLSLNFYMPAALYNYNIKGLDKKLIGCNQEQTKIVFDSYMETDGCRNIIYTSKKEEVDILQHMFVINGYCCKLFTRQNHGFSKKENYQLSVTKRTYSSLCDSSKLKLNNIGDLYWCPTVKNNHNFIARYQGSVFITGNCHDNHVLLPNGSKDYRYLNCCVEVTNYKPVTFEQLIEINLNVKC